MRSPYHPDPFHFQGDSHRGKNNELERNYGYEWEETLVEAGAAEPQKIRPLFELKKMKWLLGFVSLFLFVLIGRMFHLQIVLGKTYENEAERNRYRIQTLQAPRGVIYDSKKELLLTNAPRFDIVIVPVDFPKKSEDEKIEEIKSKLKDLGGVSDEEFAEAYEKVNYLSFDPITVKQGISRELALRLESELFDMSGVEIQKASQRNYEDAEAFSHILGYIGRINEKEIEERERKKEEYLPNDVVGKAGVELTYEEILRGEYGKRQVEVDSRGKVKKVLAKQEPKPGRDLVLSIDKDFQLYIKQRLEEASDISKKASVVALDPQTGDVLAMVTLPSYDNNLFAKGITQDQYSELLNDENKPLINRALNGLYPPGSIIKPIGSVAALEEGIVTPSTTIVDNGKIFVPNKFNPDIVYKFVGWDLDGLGPMNIFSAMAQSSDIYYYYIGGGFEDFEGLGWERLRGYYERFLLGAQTGIDLPSEAAGFIPTPEWKEEKKGEVWYLGDTYNLSIGQGDLLITPLQAAVFTSAFANGGTIYKPRVVQKVIQDTDDTLEVREFQPQIIKENFASKQHMETVKESMRYTVTDGSGRELQALPVDSGGKTGTAQFANNTKTHAWFTAFAPYDDPEITLAVLVEGGGGGQAVASPIARDILAWYFENKEKTDQDE